MFYIVFVASSTSFGCLFSSCLYYSFGVVHFAIKNNTGNVLNNTSTLNGS